MAGSLLVRVLLVINSKFPELLRLRQVAQQGDYTSENMRTWKRCENIRFELSKLSKYENHPDQRLFHGKHALFPFNDPKFGKKLTLDTWLEIAIHFEKLLDFSRNVCHYILLGLIAFKWNSK